MTLEYTNLSLLKPSYLALRLMSLFLLSNSVFDPFSFRSVLLPSFCSIVWRGSAAGSLGVPSFVLMISDFILFRLLISITGSGLSGASSIPGLFYSV